jgi:hypothetical protein
MVDVDDMYFVLIELTLLSFYAIIYCERNPVVRPVKYLEVLRTTKYFGVQMGSLAEQHARPRQGGCRSGAR